MPGIQIENDSDLPELINTKEKQEQLASKLAETQFGAKVVSVRGSEGPGAYSRTMIVTFENGDEKVIQFRTSDIDIEFCALARTKLGAVVPEIGRLHVEELASHKLFTFHQSFVPGKPWWDMERKYNHKLRLKATRSMAAILARGKVGSESSVAVPGVLAKLEKIKRMDIPEVQPFKSDIQNAIDNIDQLAAFPLFLTHIDPHKGNVHTSEKGDIVGIVDWELADRLPFGMNFACIHGMLGRYSGYRFCVKYDHEILERAFWEEVFQTLEPETRGSVFKHLEAVQLALNVATLLYKFFYGYGRHKGVVDYLPILLSYRIPPLRGDRRAYVFPETPWVMLP